MSTLPTHRRNNEADLKKADHLDSSCEIHFDVPFEYHNLLMAKGKVSTNQTFFERSTG